MRAIKDATEAGKPAIVRWVPIGKNKADNLYHICIAYNIKIVDKGSRDTQSVNANTNPFRFVEFQPDPEGTAPVRQFAQANEVHPRSDEIIARLQSQVSPNTPTTEGDVVEARSKDGCWYIAQVTGLQYDKNTGDVHLVCVEYLDPHGDSTDPQHPLRKYCVEDEVRIMVGFTAPCKRDHARRPRFAGSPRVVINKKDKEREAKKAAAEAQINALYRQHLIGDQDKLTSRQSSIHAKLKEKKDQKDKKDKKLHVTAEEQAFLAFLEESRQYCERRAHVESTHPDHGVPNQPLLDSIALADLELQRSDRFTQRLRDFEDDLAAFIEIPPSTRQVKLLVWLLHYEQHYQDIWPEFRPLWAFLASSHNKTLSSMPSVRAVDIPSAWFAAVSTDPTPAQQGSQHSAGRAEAGGATNTTADRTTQVIAAGISANSDIDDVTAPPAKRRKIGKKADGTGTSKSDNDTHNITTLPEDQAHRIGVVPDILSSKERDTLVKESTQQPEKTAAEGTNEDMTAALTSLPPASASQLAGTEPPPAKRRKLSNDAIGTEPSLHNAPDTNEAPTSRSPTYIEDKISADAQQLTSTTERQPRKKALGYRAL